MPSSKISTKRGTTGSNSSGNKLKLSTVLAVILVVIVLTCVTAFVRYANLIANNSSDQHQVLPPVSPSSLDIGKTNNKVQQKVQISSSTTSSINKNNNNNEVEYHIIFSSGCKNPHQDWQSYVFFYCAMVNKQPGIVTRIVSGCTKEKEAKLRTSFREEIAPMSPEGRFRIHFTPDYSDMNPNRKGYKYFNKPFGTKHWMENVLGFPNNPDNKDAIVILLDPDQCIVRPFENNDFSNTVWESVKAGEVPITRIEHGKPMGQLYGFGISWKKKIDMSKVTSEKSPVDEMSNREAKKYVVGPPYVATTQDMYSIVTKWAEFVVPVHDQYPELLAEMFGYCLGAAHLRLAHQVARSFMVSDTGSYGEGWKYIDAMEPSDTCRKDLEPAKLPNVLHFCQRYGIGEYMFGKFRLPDNFLTCESPLMVEPPHDIASTFKEVTWPDQKVQKLNKERVKYNAFMVCQLITLLNNAATYYKKRHCDGKGNFQNTLTYQYISEVGPPQLIYDSVKKKFTEKTV